jgi:hypothetical protein
MFQHKKGWQNGSSDRVPGSQVQSLVKTKKLLSPQKTCSGNFSQCYMMKKGNKRGRGHIIYIYMLMYIIKTLS